MSFPIKRLYLAGPMTGLPAANFRAFDYAARLLRLEGYEVFSPADSDRKMMGWAPDKLPSEDELEEAIRGGKLSYRMCLMNDLACILTWADTVAVLPRWETSRGVAVELKLATTLSMNILYLGVNYDYLAA